jgi:hypothetical protein
MTNRQRRGVDESAPSVPDFEPVNLRYRHDGLTLARQVSLTQTVAACGCIREACRPRQYLTERHSPVLQHADLRMASGNIGTFRPCTGSPTQ